jgi:hypothetical protein
MEAIALVNTNLATDSQISIGCSSSRAISTGNVVKRWENVTPNISWDPRNNDKEGGNRRHFSSGAKGSERTTKNDAGVIVADITAANIVNTNHKIGRKILESATAQSYFSFENHTLKSVRILDVTQLEVIWKEKTSRKSAIHRSAPVGRGLTLGGDKSYYASNVKVNNRVIPFSQKTLQKKWNGRLDNLENSDIVKFCNKGDTVSYYLTSYRATGSHLGKMGRSGHFVFLEKDISSPDRIILNSLNFITHYKKRMKSRSLTNIKTPRKIRAVWQSRPLRNNYRGQARVVNGTLLLDINLNPSKEMRGFSRKISKAFDYKNTLTLRILEYKDSQWKLKYFSNYSTKTRDFTFCQKENLESCNTVKILKRLSFFRNMREPI